MHAIQHTSEQAPLQVCRHQVSRPSLWITQGLDLLFCAEGPASEALLWFRLSGVFLVVCGRSVTDADVSRLHDDERLVPCLPDSLDRGPAGIARKADQDDARRVDLTHIDQWSRNYRRAQGQQRDYVQRRAYGRYNAT
jgi:hypothetical protein